MENTFKQDGYTFKEIKLVLPHRPYRVKCLETGHEKDSAISYNDAASFLTQEYIRIKERDENDTKDINYVKKIFEDTLLNRKKSECDDLVKNEIVYQNKLLGNITSFNNEDKLALYKEYQTEYFDIKVLFENGFSRKSTKIEIRKR